MVATMTAQEYQDLTQKVKHREKRHKFHAIATEIDGKKFPSKLEARYYKKLKTLQSCGDVVFFLRQVPFDLPGSVKYVCDYQIFWKDGDVSFVDVKGYDTPVSALKRKQVENLYPIKIDLVNDA